jgi:hypothetical protein
VPSDSLVVRINGNFNGRDVVITVTDRFSIVGWGLWVDSTVDLSVERSWWEYLFGIVNPAYGAYLAYEAYRFSSVNPSVASIGGVIAAFIPRTIALPDCTNFVAAYQRVAVDPTGILAAGTSSRPSSAGVWVRGPSQIRVGPAGSPTPRPWLNVPVDGIQLAVGPPGYEAHGYPMTPEQADLFTHSQAMIPLGPPPDPSGPRTVSATYSTVTACLTAPLTYAWYGGPGVTIADPNAASTLVTFNVDGLQRGYVQQALLNVTVRDAANQTFQTAYNVQLRR